MDQAAAARMHKGAHPPLTHCRENIGTSEDTSQNTDIAHSASDQPTRRPCSSVDPQHRTIFDLLSHVSKAPSINRNQELKLSSFGRKRAGASIINLLHTVGMGKNDTMKGHEAS